MTPEKANGGKKPGNGSNKPMTKTRRVVGWQSQEDLDKFVSSMKNGMTVAQWQKNGAKIKEYSEKGMFGNLDRMLDRMGVSNQVHTQVRRAKEGRLGFNNNMGYRVSTKAADGSVEEHMASPQEIKLIQKAESTYDSRVNAWEKGGKKGPKPKPAVSGRIRNNQFK